MQRKSWPELELPFFPASFYMREVLHNSIVTHYFGGITFIFKEQSFDGYQLSSLCLKLTD